MLDFTGFNFTSVQLVLLSFYSYFCLVDGFFFSFLLLISFLLRYRACSVVQVELLVGFIWSLTIMLTLNARIILSFPQFQYLKDQIASAFEKEVET